MSTPTTTIKVLRHVNLHIRPGENVALVGPSGGGKTTLCNLIPRFYDVTGGTILIDGQDVRSVTLHSLRRPSAWCSRTFTFQRHGGGEHRLWPSGATRAEIEEAARLAGADAFVRALKDGYDTYVGERGVKLSGGQKQRLAIARVFLKNPRILLLDEATKCPGQRERDFWSGQSLDKLAKGRTTLTIAHRLTTIKNADRILVLGRDGIEEEGSHDELLAKQGVYYRLWNGLVSGETL